MLLQPLYPSFLELSLFWYFFAVNVVYTILFIFGIFHVYVRRKELGVEDFSHIIQSNSLPEISFVIPMYNEEKNIISAIQSLLNLSYRYKEIIVVNDGSTDRSVDVLKEAFDLIPIPQLFDAVIATERVLGIYRSTKDPRVVVIDKEHGRRFDAINAGVNACSNPFFIVVDADTYVDDMGFEAMVRPLFENPSNVAIGASVRVRNGCTMDFNCVDTDSLSLRFLPVFQGIEYLRAFLQRQGWNYLGGNFVIAGAFSIFPTEIIRNSGGLFYSVAEDMEIIVRLHRLMHSAHRPYQISYLPDPVAWTEVPTTIRGLGRQRVRWHLGLLETIWYHKSLCFNPRYGWFGLFAYPFWIWGEALEPVMEAVGYGIIITTWFMGTLNSSFALLLIFVTLGFSFVYSLLCLFLEEMSFRRYRSLKTVFTLMFLSLIENVGYRQLTLYWRLKAFFKFLITFPGIHKNSKKLQQELKRCEEAMRSKAPQ